MFILYIGYKLENHNFAVAHVCIENRPKGQIDVSKFEDFSIWAFLMAALWEKKKSLTTAGNAFLAAAELAFLSTFAHVGASFRRIEGCVPALLQDDRG